MLPILTARHLLERAAKIDPHWQNNTKGIYADFADGRDKPRFYAKCPNCSYVHGDYKSFEQAFYDRLCPLCKAKAGEKYRDEVVKSRKPEKAKRPGYKFKLRVESIVRALLGQ